MCSDLVRGAIVDSQRKGSSANIEAKCFPRKGLLKYALAEIACEEKAVAACGCEGGEEPSLCHTQVLRLVDYSEVVGARIALAESVCHAAEHIRPCHQATVSQPRTDPIEDGPEGFTLLAADPGLPAKPRNIAVVRP